MTTPPTSATRIHRTLEHLPNIEGFRFIGITHFDGSIPCVVEKGKSGCHFVVEEESGRPIWNDLWGWMSYKDTLA